VSLRQQINLIYLNKTPKDIVKIIAKYVDEDYNNICKNIYT